MLLTFETFKKEKSIQDRIGLSTNNVWNKIQKYYLIIDFSLITSLLSFLILFINKDILIFTKRTIDIKSLRSRIRWEHYKVDIRYNINKQLMKNNYCLLRHYSFKKTYLRAF